MFPAIAKDWAPSHQSDLVQDFIKTKLNVVSSVPKNGLHLQPIKIHWIIFIWTLLRQRFTKEDLENRLHQKLNLKKISVWNICANDLVEIRRAIEQFVSWIKAVEKKARKVYQNCVWLMLLRKNSSSSLYAFSIWFIPYCRTCQFSLFHTDIFSKPLKRSLYF